MTALPPRWLALACAALAAALGPAACRERASAPAAPSRRYTVRGEVVRAPAGGAELLVRHEAIDDFADRDGKVVGMESMVMPFRIAPPVSAQGLAPGDAVELTFAVGWDPPTLRVERIERLPPGTVLHFGPARR